MRALLITLFLSLAVLIGFTQTTAYKYHPALKAKDYQRAELFESTRSDINGSMKPYVQTLQRVNDSIRKNDKRNTIIPVQWQPLGPSKTTLPVLSQIGLVSALWIDRSDYLTIYAGSNTGGIFATYDGGENWKSLSDNYITTGVLAIQVDPKNRNHLYIGTGHWGFNRAYGQGVMESFDGGQTWSATGLNSSTLTAGFLVQDLVMHPVNSDTLYATVNTEFNLKGYIYRSFNKGKDWAPVYMQPKLELFDFVWVPRKPDVLYAVGNKFLRSSDAGDTWLDLTDKFELKPDFKISRIALSVSDTIPGLMIAFAESYDTLQPNVYDHQLYRSFDEGRTFYKVGIDYLPYAGYWKMELQLSPCDNNEFYLGGISLYKYRMDADSARFIPCSDHKYHKDVRDMHVFKEGCNDWLFMGNDGGVTKSYDGANNWIDITRNGMQSTQFYNITISENSRMMYGGPQDGNLCFYNYDTKEWTKETHIGDAYDGMIDYDDPDIVYIVSYPPAPGKKNMFLLKSTNAGLNFAFRGVPDSTEAGRNNIPVAMHPVNPKILYAGLKNVWKSTDGAETWQKISSFPAQYNHKLLSLEVSASNPDVICASFENPAWGDPVIPKLWITSNGGDKWFDITPRGALSLDYGAVTDILIHPDKPATIWLAIDRTWNDHRVYLTNDGGRNWSNFSEGLPPIPVNALRYIKGAGYDILLAATDAGVYYRDALMNRWVIFGEGMPLTIVSEIEINYARKKIVAGTFGRGLWETDFCLPIDEAATTISDTLVWPANKNILSDLVLLPGSKLTIRGKAEVGDGRTIKVMPGATLILENATLTNNCKNLWKGIRLYGHADFNSDLPQGKIVVTFGSVIENAFIGIETVGIDENGNETDNLGGGIIYSKDAVFRNNLCAIDIKPTTGMNPSRFILTDFIIQKQLFAGNQMSEMVRINSNKGLEFVSCTFENTVPFAELPINERGIGINCYNSDLAIKKISSDSIPFGTAKEPLFNQFFRGIQATVGAPGYSVNLSDILFKNNYTGVYLAAVNAPAISNCTFRLGSNKAIDAGNRENCGVYLDHCPQYYITENKFVGIHLFGVIDKETGLVINDCGNLNNMVSGNSFSNLNYSVLAQNRNRNKNGNDGLRFYNNWFTSNEYDICVTTDSLHTINGIAYHQGSIGYAPAEPAGNQFSNTKFHRDKDLHNEGEPIIYSHYYNSLSVNHQIPVFYANAWLVQNAFAFPGDSTYRPSYLKIEPSGLARSIKDWQYQALQAENQYTTELDGGNTSGLINEVKSTLPEHSVELYKKLRKLDSKLSADVLVALAANNNFHNTLFKDILEYNPLIFRINNYIELINDRDPEMPAFMLQPLANTYRLFSKVELLQGRRDNIKAISDALFTRQINNLWFDNSPEALEELHILLAGDDRIESRLLLAGCYNNSGDQAQAKGVLQDALSNFPSSATSVYHIEQLLNIHNALLNYPGDTLTDEYIQMLEPLLDDSLTFMYAQNILAHFNNTAYSEPYILPGTIKATVPFEVPEINITGSGFRVYPQPSSNFVIVDYCFEEGITNGKLEITNITGQRILETSIEASYGQQVMDVNNLFPGLYIIAIKSNNTILDRQKMLIVR